MFVSKSETVELVHHKRRGGGGVKVFLERGDHQKGGGGLLTKRGDSTPLPTMLQF